MPVPAALPKLIENPPAPEIEASPPLSLFARPGDGSIRTRRIAILVADGVAGADLKALHDGLTAEGAIPRFVGARLGNVESADGDPIVVDATFEAVPAVLYDALVVPGGREAIKTLGNLGHAAEFVKEQYRHCKPILVLGAGQDLVENAGVPLTLSTGDADPGILHSRMSTLRRPWHSLSKRLRSIAILPGNGPPAGLISIKSFPEARCVMAVGNLVGAIGIEVAGHHRF